VLIAEGIRRAQAETGKKVITVTDLRNGLEKFDLSEARLKEIGTGRLYLADQGCRARTMKVTTRCGVGQQWDGKDWKRVST
jgi:hypothetical protein